MDHLRVVSFGASDVLLLLLDHGGNVEEVDLLKDLLDGQALPSRHVGLGIQVHFLNRKRFSIPGNLEIYFFNSCYIQQI